MRSIRLAAMLGAILAAGVLRAEDNVPACGGEPGIPPKLKRPQDFAPPELVVVPRPAEEYLPKKSLLAQGVGGRRPVNAAELHRRQLAMYSGVRQTNSVPGIAGDATGPVVAPVTSLPPAEFNWGAAAFWGSVGLMVLVALALLTRTLLSFRHVDMKHRRA
jgi:hypothetical protein